MYTSSDDDSDHDESSTSPQQHPRSHQSPPKMKFTTFGKGPPLQEDILFEEGRLINSGLGCKMMRGEMIRFLVYMKHKYYEIN